ncbi:MAG TPA: ATPase domain-containing protein [Nitrososphaerales archaeon]|nr:ATPase domain-containing protein [Nitrososphaerales archaeon]
MNHITKALNQLLNDDSLPDGLTMLSGPSGTGKTIFAAQYAYETVVNNGRALWITTEELPSTLRSTMSRFGWNVDRLEIEEKFRIVDAVSSARLGLSENMGRGVLGLDPTGMLIVITEQLRHIDAGHDKFLIIIDSISRLLLSCDTKSVIDFVSCLSSRLENYRASGIATLAEGAHDEKILNSVIFSSSGTFRFRTNEAGQDRRKQFRIETMRGRKHDDAWKNYKISDTGMDIEI